MTIDYYCCGNVAYSMLLNPILRHSTPRHSHSSVFGHRNALNFRHNFFDHMSRIAARWSFCHCVKSSRRRDPTAWLAWKDSNSETSSQIIPLKGRIDLWESSRISGHKDYSRLSCDAGDTQLGPKTKISARILRGRWSTGRYLFQLAPSGAGFFSLRIPEFESADPGILNSPVVMCANLRAPQSGSKSLPQLHIHHAAAQT